MENRDKMFVKEVVHLVLEQSLDWDGKGLNSMDYIEDEIEDLRTETELDRRQDNKGSAECGTGLSRMNMGSSLMVGSMALAQK